jgi:hypothetical protein
LIIALGDGKFPSTMRGTVSGLAGRLPKSLKKAEYEGLLIAVLVTEFRTYIVCYNCADYLTFDHLKLCSHQRDTDGSYSIGNIQTLSSCLNHVKGNYPERELTRWLIRLLECYQERYD